jgi:serine/threonine protein kinase
MSMRVETARRRDEEQGMAEEGQHVGATIAGKYRIRRLIGVGGMGSVYEGQHVELAKKVAIKIIDSPGDTSAELAMRFRREARAASAVESEGIVQVFDVGRDPEVGLFMVMELLQGEDLENRLRKQPERRLEPALVAQIGYQAARALVKAHAARVIHRDLKPANLFLTDRDDGSLRVKILDFGISKLLASDASIATGKDGLLALTQAGVALGTPQYMSPEQAQGLTTVDHRCDVWGLGVVLYEALAGMPAYPELGTYQDTIINMLQPPPIPLSVVAPWVPEALANVVHAAIQHNVAARIQDCATFATRLDEAIPDALMASTGPFTAAHRARMSSHFGFAPAAPATPSARAAASAVPALVMSPTASPIRPITLGDDTQVVVRSSDPLATYEESDSTMLADSARLPRRGSANPPPRANVEIFGPRPDAHVPDDAPQSTGDPTMFQGPAWVEQANPNEGPSTLKTGLSLAERPTLYGHNSRQGIAALITALVVVAIGGSLLLFALRESPMDTGAAAPIEAVDPAAAAGAQGVADPGAPAPPGTGLVPVAPATGGVLVGNAPPEVRGDASATNGVPVDSPR